MSAEPCRIVLVMCKLSSKQGGYSYKMSRRSEYSSEDMEWLKVLNTYWDWMLLLVLLLLLFGVDYPLIATDYILLFMAHPAAALSL